MASLNQIDHLVVLMLENRSFDNMLGFLYTDQGNRSPSGQPFEGLTGTESNPDGNGGKVTVFRIDHTKPGAYFMPGSVPGEEYLRVNIQLFGTKELPTPAPAATNEGFVTDFAEMFPTRKGNSPDVTAADIMGCFPPEALPVLSGLARGYAVCDHWYCSVPTQTMPNRAFALAGTSQGLVSDKACQAQAKAKKVMFDTPSIFGRLSDKEIDWRIYGYNLQPLTRADFPDTKAADEQHFGRFMDFKNAAADGSLPAFTFLEPAWKHDGNSQHPNDDVAQGEQLILDVYNALRTGPDWAKTLLVITYDEHGGCYDHVPPPAGATPPDESAGEEGFDFTRFGVRVPTVLVSPLIAPGTVFRVPDDSVPLDHTSVLKTIQERWGVDPLTARDAAAPGIGEVLTLDKPRDDNPLEGVIAPVAQGENPARAVTSHLEEVYNSLVAENLLPGD
ncbi:MULTISPECIES: alkaline phosphatase family protein [unclassified Streptomyces]|uniref:alkaline phosphatase family protein n=1 Tax=unclassified Streptomyces TaxID=2593676 RepID=UPI000364496A|nr:MULTISPECIES: alkaline phosphatase family protein [unclassified Streptomyces]MYT28958.1 phosphoesterase [Streptomyces sp. SID8354]